MRAIKEEKTAKTGRNVVDQWSGNRKWDGWDRAVAVHRIEMERESGGTYKEVSEAAWGWAFVVFIVVVIGIGGTLLAVGPVLLGIGGGGQ